MEFDEYDYLEKTVENPEPFKSKEVASGGDDALNSAEEDKSRSAKHKSKEKDGKDDGHRSLKRSNGDESRDQDRHRERNSSRHRSRSRDREQVQYRSSREHKDRDRGKEREKDREREERNGKERDRDAERERGRDKRERGREREREKERERSRRSRSRSERRRSDLDEREKEKGRDKEYRERERERDSREHDKESRKYREKKEEPTEPEADPERDQRTVFAYQICLKARDKDVYDFFSRAGKVRDVRLIMDRNSRRSKGVGYVEFYDVMSVPMAIALSGQLLLGQPVMVKPSEAEKNLAQSTTTVNAGSGPYSGGARKLYVGNLHYSITEDQLRQVFEPFGTVELVQLPLDETGHCKGFGFVQFAQIEDARSASNLNGQVEIAGRPIKVSIVTDQPGNQGATNAGDFDDDEGGGLALNARSRAMLMQKLDRSGTAPSIAVSTGLAAPVVPPVVAPLTLGPVPALHGPVGAGIQLPGAIPSVDTIGVPSECLLLKNMFDPSAETDGDFDLEDIKEDVQVECARFGNLKHIFVDKNSAGFVYLRFENTQSAVNAQRALNGRWFAGKMITAAFMVPQSYEAKFPDSR